MSSSSTYFSQSRIRWTQAVINFRSLFNVEMSTTNQNDILYFHINLQNNTEYTVELNTTDSIIHVSDGIHVWINASVLVNKQTRQRVTVGLKKHSFTIIPSVESNILHLFSSSSNDKFILKQVESTIALQQLVFRMSRRLSTREDLNKLDFVEPVGLVSKKALVMKRPANRSLINPHAVKRKACTGVGVEWEDDWTHQLY